MRSPGPELVEPPALFGVAAGSLGAGDLAGLIERLPVPIFRSTPEGQILVANRALAHLLGVASVAEVLARSSYSFYFDASDRETAVQRMASHGSLERELVRMRTADGRELWTRQTVRPLRDDAGYVWAHEGVLEDVTELLATAEQKRALEARFVNAFDGAPIGMALLDGQGRFTRANLALATMLGCEPGELASVADIAAGRHADLIYAEVARLVAGDAEPSRVERTLRRRDGGDVLTTTALAPICAADGTFEAALLHVVDLSARHAAEEAHRASETRFRQAFEHSPIGMVMTEARLRAVEVNPALCEMLGMTREDFLATPIAELMHPDDVAGSQENFAPVTSGELAPYQVERRLRHRAGHYLDTVLHVTGMAERSGRVTGVLTQVIDHTEQRRNAAELVQRDAENRALVDSIPDLMFRIDTAGTYRWVRAGRSLDPVVAPASLIGRTIHAMMPEVADRLVEAVREVVRERRSATVEYPIRHGGETRQFEARLVPLGADETLWLVRDITDLKRAQFRLEDLVRSKDEFLGSVSHELRTPLTTVVGFATELRDHYEAFTKEERRQFVALIAEQAQDMANIVDDLLVAARADVGEVAIRAAAVDMLAEIGAVLEAWPQLEIRLRADGEPIVAMADPLRLRQILRNLVSNSIRYGRGDVEIRLDVGWDDVVVEIRDDGDGIPEEQWEQVFEPYHRAHRQAGQPASVGLGLTVSRMLARRMGGDLRYRHDGDQSVFRLSLPPAR